MSPHASQAPENSPASIILVLGDLDTAASGPNAVVQKFAVWLVDRGYDVTVVGTWRGQRPSKERLRELYGRCQIIGHRRYFKDSWHFAPGAIKLATRLFLSRKLYLIDVHGIWLFNGLLLSLVARLKQWRYFVSLHGNLRPVALNKNKGLKRLALKLVFKGWLRRATGLIALNEQEMSDASQIVPNASFSIIGNGVTPHSHPLTFQRSAEVLFLGRIDPIKNIESLIDGFGQICQEFPDWNLSIVGPCANREYLQQLKILCVTLKIEDRIRFHEAAFGEEKEARFLAATVFALTSWSEGQPFAVLEAMAHGMPVVISRQCNINIPETCGRVCDCSPDDIARALKEIFILSKNELTNMRTEVLRFVNHEFSEDTLFNKRVSLYMLKG